MKKLKAWQIVLLVIFYPVGIIYFIVWLCKRGNNKGSPSVKNFDASTATIERDFHTKVAGVTFDNDNGTSRQEIIKSCSCGEDIIFKPMPSKKFPDAIGVFTQNGKQLGFLNAELAHDMKYKYATNPMSACIAGINGGEEGKNLGVNLHIVIYSK